MNNSKKKLHELIFNNKEFKYDLNNRNKFYYLDEFIINENFNDKNYILSTFCGNNKEKFYHLEKINVLKKKIFQVITKLLNGHFQIEYDEKFWRILIGPWFNFSIETFYNRLNSIRKILKNYDINKVTLNYNKEFNNISSKNTNEFIHYIDDLDWNQKVYSFVFDYLNIDINKRFVEDINHKKNEKPNFFLKTFFNIISTSIVELGDKLIVNTSLSKINEIKLQTLIKQFPLLNIYDKFSNTELKKKFDHDLRINLFKKYSNKNVNNDKDDDQDFYVKLLLLSLPLIFLENFVFFKKKIEKKKFIKNVKIIITSQNFDENEYFKFLAAFSYLNDCKLYYLQHGNVDGVTKFDIYDNHLTTPTKYYTWGWTKSNLNQKDNQNISSFYNLKSSGYKLFDKNFNFKKKLIFFGPHYYTRRHFWDVLDLNKSLFTNQLDFLKNLNIDLQNIVCVKLGDRYLNETKDKIYIINKNIKNLSTFKPAYKYDNLISIFSYDSTGFYEHLCLNKPAIMYYDFNHDDINQNAKIYYDKLKSVNIIHSSPIEAAKFINNNYVNLLDWWYSSETQLMISDFNKNYNKYTNDPVKNIVEEFKL